MHKDHKNQNHPFSSENLKEQHDKEHILWNRRQFLWTGGLAGLGTVLLGGLPVNSIMSAGIPNPMAPGDENILVLIKMFGGNDGLNMIFPHTDSAGNTAYKNLRPTIAHQYNTDYTDQTILGGFGPATHAMPGVMANLMPMWNEGNMAVLHNVGYPKQNYSHFASIDIWSSASDDLHDKRISSGMIGRYLDQDFPAFTETPPTVPPALRIGYSTDLLFAAPGNQQMELVFNDPNEFYRLAQYGKLYPTEGFGECPQGEERAYLRQLTNNSLRYSTAVSTAYAKATNKISYPRNTASRLADQLAIVSRLIKGRLGTRLYLVNLDGFDTHSNQKAAHARLMGDFANSVKAFYDDLKADNAQSNVSILTYSEFGRTIKENGSFGTDHGNLSPILLFGDGVKGGFYGDPIDLSDSSLNGNGTVVFYETQKSLDFRRIFSSVMKDWMCVDSDLVDFSMGKHYEPLDLMDNPCNTGKGSNFNTVLLGHQPSDSNIKNLEIKFATQSSSDIKVFVKSLNGSTLAILFDKFAPKGSYTVTFDPVKWKILPGEYIYQINASGKTYLRRFNVV
ncbi:MAG: DUF1501 domain-containing protein [Saprospiraceae bacterium]|nr:DUF1501 domain-containing protein [Saprospiraceae bacterium]